MQSSTFALGLSVVTFKKKHLIGYQTLWFMFFCVVVKQLRLIGPYVVLGTQSKLFGAKIE